LGRVHVEPPVRAELPGAQLPGAVVGGGVEPGAAVLPGRTAVRRGPDPAPDRITETLVGHTVQIHSVADGDDVGGDDRRDLVAVLVVDELLGFVSADGGGEGHAAG